jgi:hypothetical protein
MYLQSQCIVSKLIMIGGAFVIVDGASVIVGGESARRSTQPVDLWRGDAFAHHSIQPVDLWGSASARHSVQPVDLWGGCICTPQYTVGRLREMHLHTSVQPVDLLEGVYLHAIVHSQ